LSNSTEHRLPEIRSRAAETLQFKLGNQLLTLADLVHEQSFHRALLTWLNGFEALGASGISSALFLLDTIGALCQVRHCRSC
jgi:hypothetical protein